jgi:hypothetical protein
MKDRIRDVRIETTKNVYRLELYDTGRTTEGAFGTPILAYRFTQIQDDYNVVLFEGNDFSPSVLTPIDSDESVRALIHFLTLKPGDTDKEYFENYTPTQLEWCQTVDAEQILCDYTIEDSPEIADSKHLYPFGFLTHWNEPSEAKKIRRAINGICTAILSLQTEDKDYPEQVTTLVDLLLDEEKGLYKAYAYWR